MVVPKTGLTEKTVPCSLAQITPGAEITPGMAGAPLTLMQRGALAPQPFTAVTQSCPVVNELEKVTSTVLVPFAVAKVAPEGNVQL